MFDVVPPGEDPTNIRPTAYSSDRLNMRANAKEIIGMKKYWLAQPIAIAWGFPMAVRTASFVVEAPSPSPMMTRNAAETNVAASTIVQTANRTPTPDHNNQTNHSTSTRARSNATPVPPAAPAAALRPPQAATTLGVKQEAVCTPANFWKY